MALTDVKIRGTKPSEKPVKLTDAGGLYLDIRPSGSKLWRYRYRIAGRENLYAMGKFCQAPSRESAVEAVLRKASGRFTLAEARQERDRCRALVKQGIHPAHNRHAQRAGQFSENANTFKAAALEWIENKKSGWSPYYHRQVERFLERDVFPHIGSFPVRSVTAAHLLQIVRRVEGRGAKTVALLLRQWSSAIFRYSIATLRADADPAAALKGSITRPRTDHSKPLTRADIRDLSRRWILRRLSHYGNRPTADHAHFRSHGGTTCRALGGNRLQPRGMAHPCRTHEDARAAYRSAVTTGPRASTRATYSHRGEQLPFSELPQAQKLHDRNDLEQGARAHGLQWQRQYGLFGARNSEPPLRPSSTNWATALT